MKQTVNSGSQCRSLGFRALFDMAIDNICGLRAPGSNIPTGVAYCREWTYGQMDADF